MQQRENAEETGYSLALEQIINCSDVETIREREYGEKYLSEIASLQLREAENSTLTADLATTSI